MNEETNGVDIEYQNPEYNPKRKIEHSVSLQSGAAGTIFKVDPQGMFVGGTKFSTAPYRLDYDGNLRMGPLTNSGLGLNGTDGTFDLYYNDALVGNISGLETPDGAEDTYVKLYAISGRYLSIQQSKVKINGDLDITGSYKRGNTAGVNSLSEANVNTFSIEIKGGIITNFQKNS
jgi:hypothetical protein